MGKKANVFISDVVAAALMCSSKANYSWDLIINKTGGIIFIDKRDEENMLDWQCVSETAQPDWHPLDEEGKNGARQLMKEAATINIDFLAATLSEKNFGKLELDDPNDEDED